MSSKIRDIEIKNLIGQSSKFRVYLGHRDDGQKVIVKIAKTFDNNNILAKDAKVFNSLKAFESHLRDLSDQHNVNYNLLFAQLLSSSMEPSQDDRRINVFLLPEIDLDTVMPLAKLSAQMEIDARSSVWIIGRLLKFYGIFELMKTANDADACNYPIFNSGDYFIGPEVHRLIYYNVSDEITDAYATDIIKMISKYMLSWMVFDDTVENQKYANLLEDFSKYGRDTASKAHKDLYDLVREVWGIHYYPFTYRTKDSIDWKIIKED